MSEYLSSDSTESCKDYCVYDAGYNCRCCERFTNTEYYKQSLPPKAAKIDVRKHYHHVEDLICFGDYIRATGLDETDVYQKWMDDCNFYWESDGDFIIHISLDGKDEATQKLIAQLPDDVVKRGKLGVEYEQ